MQLAYTLKLQQFDHTSNYFYQNVVNFFALIYSVPSKRGQFPLLRLLQQNIFHVLQGILSILTLICNFLCPSTHCMSQLYSLQSVTNFTPFSFSLHDRGVNFSGRVSLLSHLSIYCQSVSDETFFKLIESLQLLPA